MIYTMSVLLKNSLTVYRILRQCHIRPLSTSRLNIFSNHTTTIQRTPFICTGPFEIQSNPSMQIRTKKRTWMDPKRIRPTDEEFEERVLKVCRSFDKITADKLTLDSHFINDLGLDSLDHVEIVMAMEDEFFFEIPDMDADKLMTPRDIIRYVADRNDIYD